MNHIALLLGVILLVASPLPLGAGTLASGGDWHVVASRSESGAAVCHAGIETSTGDRLILLRTAERLVVIARHEAWSDVTGAVTVAFAIDDQFRQGVIASAQHASLVLDWPATAPVGDALRRGQTLTLTSPEGAAVFPLAGAGAAIDALDACHLPQAEADAHETTNLPNPMRQAPPAALADAELALAFETWLHVVAPHHAPAVQAPRHSGAPFRLETTQGGGTIHLLPGTTHADVLAYGRQRLKRACPGLAAVVEHDRHDLNGLIVQRTGLRCADEPALRVEAVVVSYCNEPGGLAVFLADAEPSGSHAARAFTAAVVEALAANEGFVLDLPDAAVGS